MYPDNTISTSKYNIITFLPLNLMLQMSKSANVYFCIMLVLEYIPQLGYGLPDLIMPIAFVIGVSMIKDIYEDVMRHNQDSEENNRWTQIGYHNRTNKKKPIGCKFVPMQWHKVKVGQIVKVYQDQFFPCDLLLINSSLPNGVCYIETKNLDGESNLKHK